MPPPAHVYTQECIGKHQVREPSMYLRLTPGDGRRNGPVGT